MRVLVTGSAGYIGIVVAPMLAEEGFDVVGLDSDFYRGCVFGREDVRLPLVRKDIRDLAARDLEGFDAVAHFAALSNDPLGDLNPALTDEINHRATVRLAELARAAGVSRFLFSSSCSMYGAAGDAVLDEDAPFNPVTPYAESKVLAERSLVRLATDEFSPVYLRNTTAYGLSSRMRFDLVLNNLTAWAVASGRVRIKSDGTPWRPLVHIEDIGRAFIAALRAPREVIHNRAFNVGIDEENFQVRELAAIVKETVPGCDIDFAEGGGPDQRSYRVDFGRIRRELPDFQPRWTARAGARQLYDALVEAKVTVEEFEGPRYRRIDSITSLLASGRIDATLRWRTG
jgi:nucleoside-diphosphate-sugar epimerase